VKKAKTKKTTIYSKNDNIVYMIKQNYSLLSLLALVFITGCTGSIDPSQLNEVQNFLAQYPDATIQTTFLSADKVAERINEIHQDCPELDVKAYNKVEVDSSALTLVAYINEDGITECSLTKNNGGVTMTTLPSTVPTTTTLPNTLPYTITLKERETKTVIYEDVEYKITLDEIYPNEVILDISNKSHSVRRPLLSSASLEINKTQIPFVKSGDLIYLNDTPGWLHETFFFVKQGHYFVMPHTNGQIFQAVSVNIDSSSSSNITIKNLNSGETTDIILGSDNIASINYLGGVYVLHPSYGNGAYIIGTDYSNRFNIHWGFGALSTYPYYGDEETIYIAVENNGWVFIDKNAVEPLGLNVYAKEFTYVPGGKGSATLVIGGGLPTPAATTTTTTTLPTNVTTTTLPNNATNTTTTSSTTTSTTTTTTQPSSSTETIEMVSGFNYVGFPVKMVDKEASDLAGDITKQGGEVISIQKWDTASQTFTSWSPSASQTNNFSITDGEGYIIRLSTPVSFSVSGKSFTAPVAHTYTSGFNLVSYPYLSQSYNSKTLAEGLSELGAEVVSVQRWDASSQTSVSWASAAPDANTFNIENDEAYYVRFTTPPSSSVSLDQGLFSGLLATAMVTFNAWFG
jgi:hypothetical protein